METLRPEVVMWLAITAMALGPSIAWAYVAGRRAKYENELKQSMVERGMSASEIERVLSAGGTKREVEEEKSRT